MSEAPVHGRFRRQVVVNTLATGAGSLWAMLVGLVSLPLMLRGLGATGFGLWVILQTFSAITGWFSLADLGVGTAAVRSIATSASAGDQERVRRSIGTTLTIFTTLGLGSLLLLGAVGPFALPLVFRVPHHLLQPFRLATVILAAQVAGDLVTEGAESCLEGLQRVDISRAVDAYRRTVVAVGASTAALATGSLAWVALTSAICSLTGLGVALTAVRRHTGGSIARFDRSEAWALFRYGRTVAVLRPLGVVQRIMDRVVVGIVLGPATVAIVEVATQVLNGADAVLGATSYAVVPASSWLRAREGRQQLQELLLRGTRYSLLATWLVCAAGAGLAGPFVHVWVGSHYSHAPTLIAIALAGEAIAAPCQVGSNLLLGTGRARGLLRPVAIALVVNLVASVALVEMVGTEGTFLGTVIANVIILPLVLRAALREASSTTWSFVRASILPCVLPAVGLLAAAWTASRASLPASEQLAVGIGAGTLIFALGITAVPTTRREISEMARSIRRDR